MGDFASAKTGEINTTNTKKTGEIWHFMTDVTCNARCRASGLLVGPQTHYIKLRLLVPVCGCLYESHRNTNPITGISMSIGRTSPTFPGEKLCAAIIW